MEKQTDDQLLAFWEERFPGKSIALLEVLRPFYGWMPAFRPPVEDIEERAQKAIFWRKITGVRLVRITDGSFVDFLDDASCMSIYDSYWSTPEDTHYEFTQDDAVIDSLCTTLEIALGQSFKGTTWGPLRSFLLGKEGWSSYYGCAIYLPSMAIVIGLPELAKRFRTLQELWLAHNWPIAIDGRGRLVVQVGESAH